jgi:hypothetical protein
MDETNLAAYNHVALLVGIGVSIYGNHLYVVPLYRGL